MSNGFRRPRLANAAALAVALGVCLGLEGAPARAGFLADVSATLSTPSTGAGTVAGSTVTFTADYIKGSGGLLGGAAGVTPISSPASGMTEYSWTVTFPALGTPGFALTSTIDGVAGSTTDLVTAHSPITGFYVSGSNIYIAFAGYFGDPLPTGTPNYTTYASINAFQNSIHIGLIPPNVLGSPGGAGGLTPVPEPSTIALLGVGGLTILAPRLRRRLRRRSA